MAVEIFFFSNLIGLKCPLSDVTFFFHHHHAISSPEQKWWWKIFFVVVEKKFTVRYHRNASRASHINRKNYTCLSTVICSDDGEVLSFASSVQLRPEAFRDLMAFT
jgi:hypothetical protein